jgi:hypothetical protein
MSDVHLGINTHLKIAAAVDPVEIQVSVAPGGGLN